MGEMDVSPSVRRFPIDGGLLLLDTLSGSLFAFNDTAGHVWDLVVGGRSRAAVVDEFASHWGIAPAQARSDVSLILRQWRDLGLLGGRERAMPQPRSASPATVDLLAAPQPRSATRWTCTIRGRRIAFAVADELAAPFRSLFAHLEAGDGPPHMRLEIRTAAGGDMLLLEDGRERIRDCGPGQITGALYQAVLERIYPGVAWLALIHGAALARNGTGIGLPGPSGSGKSTLAAALLDAGFEFLADDLIASAAPEGAIMPWPMPLSIKPGSVDVVAARHPELAQAARYRTKGLEARLLVPPATVWDAEPLRLATLVFPCFIAGAPPVLRPISSFEAVERLLADRVWIGHPITEERVTRFLAWLQGIPSYALSYGDLDDAVRLIESAVA